MKGPHSGGSGPPTGFTVGPPAGPYMPTTCHVDPNTFANQVAFNVISQTLMAISISFTQSLSNAGNNDLYWVDLNTHPSPDPNAPNDPSTASSTSPPGLPLYSMSRTGCQANDLLPAPPITWPIK
jgi:hypothetical protein